MAGKPPAPAPRTSGARGRRSDGDRSRGVILDAAMRLATVEGIDGLSIGRLAEATGMSKSGLFGLFGSKVELQLAMVDTASDVFAARVTRPAEDAPTAIERLRRLIDGYLDYLGDELFPGGCFFASVLAEVDMRPGPLRDRLVAFLAAWLERLQATVRDAQAEGTLEADEEAAQLAFEIEALLLLANAQHVVDRSPEPIERARRAVHRRLGAW